jgi:predicted HTH domain antitoxin
MSIKVTIDLPDDAFTILRTDPANFVREMRLAAAVKWYELGKVSQSKAAELTGLSRQEFLYALNRFNVSPYQMTPNELREEIADAQNVGYECLSYNLPVQYCLRETDYVVSGCSRSRPSHTIKIHALVDRPSQ